MSTSHQDTVPVADVVAALREEAKRVRFVAAWNSAADFIEREFGLAPAHEANAALQVGPAGMSAYIAWCPCGWRGDRAFRTRDEAAEAGSHHVADNSFEACGLGICAKRDGHDGPCDY